jgi:hypothetical protein
MTERIKELAEQAGSTDELKKLAQLIVMESLCNFYRQYYDDESEDISTQIERYVEDTFKGNDRLDRLEEQLRKQAEEKNT